MFLKFFGMEIRTLRSYYGLGKYAKELLFDLNGKELRIELR